MGTGTSSSTPELSTPAQYLKGVGPQRAELLAKIGLKTAVDLLFFFPRSYQDMSELRTIDQLRDDSLVSVCGHVEEIDLRNTGVGRSMLGVLIRQDTQFLRALWFNQPYMRDKFRVGQRVLLSGTPKRSGFRWEMVHPRVSFLGDDEEPPAGRILPVYGLTEGIRQPAMRRIVSEVVASHTELVDEVLPESFRSEHQLWGIHDAIRQIHEPANQESLDAARRRFVYQELLVMQLAIAIRRWKSTNENRSLPLPATAQIDARITRLFPFELTNDQRTAIDEIAADMAREHPMNRLLQGDVGSGKTVVAEYAMLLTIAHGQQAVLMAPTEILAQQHVQTLQRDLAHSRVRLGLLTGSIGAAARRDLLAAAAAGEVDIVIGTHAVLQEQLQFKQLGLVVIDEQHKFGVSQRAALRQSGLDPHYLVMTATPIPRTMSMTLFGDLDVSTLRDPPPGRQVVHTYLGNDELRDRWWQFYQKHLREGRQGYVIAPRVDESNESELAAVEQLFEQLVNGPLEAFRVDLIHGRQSPSEKEAAMSAFRDGETQVLVATSVIEVGVDVPNATLMTIENGERFGLAQLHQLRGRISRGVFPGYLCIFANPGSDDAQQRLDSFTKTTDGFELAEVDFQLRGPGDLFSERQHGLPPLRVADLQRDGEVLGEARRDARQLIDDDPELAEPSLARLRRMVLTRYGTALELGDVG